MILLSKENESWKQRYYIRNYFIPRYQLKEGDRIKQIEEIKNIYDNQIKNEFTSVVKGADQQRQ
jgi:hypothetical protein